MRQQRGGAAELRRQRGVRHSRCPVGSEKAREGGQSDPLGQKHGKPLRPHVRQRLRLRSGSFGPRLSLSMPQRSHPKNRRAEGAAAQPATAALAVPGGTKGQRVIGLRPLRHRLPLGAQKIARPPPHPLHFQQLRPHRARPRSSLVLQRLPRAQGSLRNLQDARRGSAGRPFQTGTAVADSVQTQKYLSRHAGQRAIVLTQEVTAEGAIARPQIVR